MRWGACNRLGMVEIVAKFFGFGRLAFDQLGADHTFVPQESPKRGEYLGAFCKAFGEDIAGSVQRRLHIGNAQLGIHKGQRDLLRHRFGISQQRLGERLESGLTRSLRATSPPGLEGQIEVFERLLGHCRIDGDAKGISHLTLVADAGEDRQTAGLEIAQIDQALLERTQLRVIETIGGFLAIAGDEGNGRAAVEQVDSRLDLTRLNRKFGAQQTPHTALGGKLLGSR